MELSSLYELIDALERGTKVHIGVLFLGSYGGAKCALPDSHTIHSKEVCDVFKSDSRGLGRCIRCRNLALRRAVRDKAPFVALCINGVYEYTHPIVVSGEVKAVIFIGNILTDEGRLKLEEKANGRVIPYDTMECGMGYEECKRLSELIDGYVQMLVEKHPASDDRGSSLIENVKSYVLSNLEYDHTLYGIAALFFYNEAYLGRLFLEECGITFKEYLNRERIEAAKKLLLTDISVTEAAARVGYNSVTYFNRVFKKHTGYAPTEYKKIEINK